MIVLSLFVGFLSQYSLVISASGTIWYSYKITVKDYEKTISKINKLIEYQSFFSNGTDVEQAKC